LTAGKQLPAPQTPSIFPAVLVGRWRFEDLHQRLRGHKAVAEFHEIFNLRPIYRLAVQPQTEPATRANIRRKIEALRFPQRAIDVFAEGRFATHRDNAVAVVIVQKVGEHFAAYAKIGVIAARTPLGFRQGEANLRQFDETGVFA
jgi:hypothetical protein